VAHAPCGFVSDAKLALDLFRRHAVPARREHEHDKEPIAERRPGAIKGRSGSREHLITAPLASVGPASLHAVELGFATARSAFVLDAKALAHDVVEAKFLGRELVKELPKRGRFRFH